MVQTLGLNIENDIYLGADGNIVLLSGIEAVAGGCETISRTQLGEMVYSTTQGIPNFQAVWNGIPNFKIWQSYLQNALQNVSGVTQVSNLSFLNQDGTLSYEATIQTQYGITTING
jgi:hypothetical protein